MPTYSTIEEMDLFWDDPVELFYSPGDRVVLIKDNPDRNPDLVIDCLGTVVTDTGLARKNMADWVSVAWDKKVSNGHTCSNPDLCEDGHGWNVPREFIALCPADPPEPDDDSIANADDIMSFLLFE